VSWRRLPPFAATLAAAVVVAACGGDPAPTEPPVAGAPSPDAPTPGPEVGADPWFEEVTAEVGLDFVHDAGLDGTFFMPEILGPGGALFDADGDGLLDLFLVDGGAHGEAAAAHGAAGVDRLYRQLPSGTFADVTFADVTATAGVGGDGEGFGMGAAVGDVDNDGDLDLYVTRYGPDLFYRNLGGGTFAEVTAEAGLGGDGWSTSAGFFDYDGDGFLDLYVTRYVDYRPGRRCATLSGQPEYCGPDAFRGLPDLLYRNLGDGTFADVTAESGVGRVAGRGLGVVLEDLDGDGRSDVFVANDGEENQLWINLGDGRFEDRALVLGVAVNLLGRAEASMGVAAGDVDADGDLDLFVTHLDQETNTLYLGAGGGYEDRVAGSGLGSPSLPCTGFGTGLFDADLDGDLDLVVANGKVRLEAGAEQRVASAGLPAAGEPAPDDGALDRSAMVERLGAYAEPNQLFENLGEGRFADRSARETALVGRREISRGALLGDLDRDGDLDLLVTQASAPARLYRNVAPRQGRWLAVRALLPELSRDAVGARVWVEAGGRRWLRPVTHTSGYLTATDAAVHFGVGDVERVERVVVRWPGDGSGQVVEEVFGPFDVDGEVVVRRGEGRVP